jgi:ABC-type multidrug transport system ATPase subunit
MTMNENPEHELVALRGLSINLDGVPVLGNCDFSMKEQQGYLVRGSDENAKVALIKTIAGIYPRYHVAGRVLFRGVDIYDAPEDELKRIRKQVAYVFFDGTMISNLTIAENLLLPVQYHNPGYDRAAVKQKIADGLDYFKIPDILDQRPDALFYTVKKKLSFIRAALMEPQLIVIDKPMFNLDEKDRELVVNYLVQLKTGKTAFLLVTQFPTLLEGLIDETFILEDAAIRSGT